MEFGASINLDGPKRGETCVYNNSLVLKILILILTLDE